MISIRVVPHESKSRAEGTFRAISHRNKNRTSAAVRYGHQKHAMISTLRAIEHSCATDSRSQYEVEPRDTMFAEVRSD
jgi:hypothetical protein